MALVMREGYDEERIQSLPYRAPEVWRGLGCWHSSDIWSLGVTVRILGKRFMLLTYWSCS